ncbi:hypothetical protein Trco_002289 [Trichoderma cornu-damae]|uniref:Uncharacterized protein n=1 Tax=Trichoderma cornu-damae TaxID=654480 RepID=A0A9P8QTE4_9HYPO|nr:hypothetical protein Trco_002289 [Trichoderma cornu-damae]
MDPEQSDKQTGFCSSAHMSHDGSTGSRTRFRAMDLPCGTALPDLGAWIQMRASWTLRSDADAARRG